MSLTITKHKNITEYSVTRYWFNKCVPWDRYHGFGSREAPMMKKIFRISSIFRSFVILTATFSIDIFSQSHSSLKQMPFIVKNCYRLYTCINITFLAITWNSLGFANTTSKCLCNVGGQAVPERNLLNPRNVWSLKLVIYFALQFRFRFN